MAGANSAWGIDVGVSAVKAIKLRKDGGRVTVEAFEVIEHDKFLTEADVDRDALIRGSLQKFMNKYNVKRDVVYISVPGSMTFARFVKLPPVETKKIPEIVRFEAIQQIPFPLDQVNWDYHTFQHPDSPDVEVGIFAMKKELVAQVMSNFTAVEMPVQGVQMGPLAVYNAAAYDGMTEEKGTIVIDMGAEHTDLVIMDQGRVWLRSINIGGNHFTDALAKSFKQSFAKAESLKKTAATSKYQKQIYQSMRPIFADLVAEIQRSIGHYSSSHRDSRLDRIVGMGNPFKLPNLQKYLQQELKMDVIRVENFQNANVEKAAAFNESILAMPAAYGLAVQALGMGEIKTNLLPVEIARKMMWRSKQPWFVGAAALVALGAAGMFGQYWMASTAFAGQSQQKEENEAKVRQAKDQVDAFTNVANTWEQDDAKLKSQMKLTENRSLWPMLQMDIFNSLPQAQPGGQGKIVILDMQADYKGKLSDWDTDQGTVTNIGTFTPPAAAGGGAADAGTTFVDPRAAMMGQAQAPAQPQEAAPQDQTGAQQKQTKPIGPSDHGFIVSIRGYATTGKWQSVDNRQPTPKDPNDGFLQVLMKKSPVPPEATPDKPAPPPVKPFYFSSPWQGGGQMGKSQVQFGGLGGGQPQQQERGPWGNNTGPYWEMFVTEITGIKSQVTAPQTSAPAMGMPAGGGGGGFVDPRAARMGMGQANEPTAAVGAIPFPIDLVSPKTQGGQGPRPSMAAPVNNGQGYYVFKVMFKVHVQ